LRYGFLWFEPLLIDFLASLGIDAIGHSVRDPVNESLVIDGRADTGPLAAGPDDLRLGHVAAAARAVADLRLGRVDEVSTANVGVISGGTARNIVPEWCTVTAEARSHDEATLARITKDDNSSVTNAME
jgi:tripeptide aminopeptidase